MVGDSKRPYLVLEPSFSCALRVALSCSKPPLPPPAASAGLTSSYDEKCMHVASLFAKVRGVFLMCLGLVRYSNNYCVCT